MRNAVYSIVKYVITAALYSQERRIKFRYGLFAPQFIKIRKISENYFGFSPFELSSKFSFVCCDEVSGQSSRWMRPQKAHFGLFIQQKTTKKNDCIFLLCVNKPIQFMFRHFNSSLFRFCLLSRLIVFCILVSWSFVFRLENRSESKRVQTLTMWRRNSKNYAKKMKRKRNRTRGKLKKMRK